MAGGGVHEVCAALRDVESRVALSPGGHQSRALVRLQPVVPERFALGGRRGVATPVTWASLLTFDSGDRTRWDTLLGRVRLR